MRSYAAIRLGLTVVIMEAWILLTYLQPNGYWRFLPWAACFWAISPILKIRKLRSIPVLSRVAAWIAGICAFAIFLRMSYLLDSSQLDSTIALCIGVLAIAWGLHSWSRISEASDQALDEVFGTCIGSKRFQNKKAEQGGDGDAEEAV